MEAIHDLAKQMNDADQDYPLEESHWVSLNPLLLARGSGLPRLNSKVKIPLRTFCRPLWVDEGDKVRTIYDGSWGGANAHIQRRTEECTTAPV